MASLISLRKGSLSLGSHFKCDFLEKGKRRFHSVSMSNFDQAPINYEKLEKNISAVKKRLQKPLTYAEKVSHRKKLRTTHP